MSVKTLESYQEFTADGSTTYFTFNFNYVDSSEIVVGMRTGDNQYTVVDPVNYVLTKNASTDGGKIRFVTTKPCENPDDPTCGDYIDNPPPAGTIVRIERKTVQSSTADWYVSLDMKALVGLFDKLFRISQENSDKFKNTIQTFPTQQGITVRELLSEHNKKIFYWNNEKQWLDITDFTIDDVVRQTDVGNILEQANAYSDEQNALLEGRINGKLTAVDAQIDANADAIQKTREDFINADSEIHQILNSHASELTTLRGNQASLGDQVSGIEEKIPGTASATNHLITKQQLLDEEMDIRDDLNGGLSELQTQITAQAAEIATKQDQLIAGDNIVISGNVISATGTGGVGFDMQVVDQLPATGKKGVIYLVPKDGAAPDVHDEYVWIDTTQTFELIGTTQVDLTDYVKNTDYATGTVGGVVKVTGNHGLAVYQGMLIGSAKTLDSYNASANNLVMAKGTLENVKNDLVKRAVTENDITLTDEEKTAARTWVGAISNTDYAGTDGSPGTVRTSSAYGTQMVASGYLRAGVDTLESYKTRGVNSFIGKGTLENIKYDIVKQGITANTIALTDDEKAAAQAWLGVSGGGSTGGLESVATDRTLQGDGRSDAPLGLSSVTISRFEDIEKVIPGHASEDNKLCTYEEMHNEVQVVSDELTGLRESIQTKDLTVGTSEGTLNLSITAGVATIATNNGLDIVSQTKFDTAPTTDDTTTWANANDTSLVTKRQVATALSESGDCGLTIRRL